MHLRNNKLVLFRFVASVLACWSLAGLAGLGAIARGDSITYTASINTASLSSSGTPYELFLQLNTGGGLAGNSATFSNFDFGVGGGSGGQVDPLLTTVDPTANSFASGSVTLSVDPVNGSSFFAETFTAGSALSFDLTVTENGGGLTPDELAVQILDMDYNNVLTSDPDGTNSLMTVSFTGGTPVAQSFGSADGVSFAAPTLTPSDPAAAPLPGTAWAGLALLVGFAAVMQCRRQRIGHVG